VIIAYGKTKGCGGMSKKNKTYYMKESAGDRIFTYFNYFFLTLLFLITLYPIIYVVSASFSDPKALMAGRVWLFPVNFTLEGYRVVFNQQRIWMGFYNSFYYAIVGTAVNVVMTVCAAYPLSRKDFMGRRSISMIFAFTMWFSGGMIPSFLLVKNLGLVDTRWALIIPGAVSVYNMLVTRTFFQTNIPNELLESAKLDGCDDFKFLAKVALPLSGPILAVISLFYAVSHWNQFFSAMLYLNNEKLFPIQIILREVLILNTAQDISGSLEIQSQRELMSEILKNALIVVASLPVIAIYPFVQKFFIKGMLIGSVKG